MHLQNKEPLSRHDIDSTLYNCDENLIIRYRYRFDNRYLIIIYIAIILCPQKKKNSCPETSIPPITIKKPVPKPVETDKKKQVHDALMDEFKKVHRKMFLGQESNENKQNPESEDAECVVSLNQK